MIRKIGEGGFGEVWLGQSITGKFRAIKWVRRERFQRCGLSPAGVEALFRMEFAGVRHFEDLAANNPELVQILHVGKAADDNAYYYVMPLADNTMPGNGEIDENYLPLTFQRRLDNHGPMSWEDAIALLAIIACGTAALHRAGLRHGDISSDNVLWVDGKPVLADPGLTSLEGSDSGGGSPGFSDPTGGPGKAGDIFSLGRLFYHAVTGTHPAESFPALPADRMDALPVNEFAELLDRCCDPDPAKRFADADELLAFLKAAAGPILPAHPRRRSFLRHGLAVGMLGLIGIAGWKFASPAGETYDVRIDGKRLSLISKADNSLVWEREFEHPLNQAELAMLDGSRKPVVICSMRDTGSGQPGRLVALNHDGSIRWHFDTVPELQDFDSSNHGQMKLTGFIVADLDGAPGDELVVLARNPDRLYSSAIKIIGGDGKLRASYWNPGRIDLNQLVLVRKTPRGPPLLAFYGEYELIEPSINADNLTMQQKELVIGLLDPRMRGQVHAPMHRMPARMETGLLRWHRKISPPGTRGRSLHAADTAGDGNMELVLWIEALHGKCISSRRQSAVKFDLHGNVLNADENGSRVLPADAVPEIPMGLDPVDFAKLTSDRLLSHSVRDFSHQRNGEHGWHYGYAPGTHNYEPRRFQLFAHCDDRSRVPRTAWHNQDDTHLSAEAGSMHPGEHACAVRRWTSPYSGRIALVVDAIRINGADWGIATLEIHHRENLLTKAMLGKTRFQAVFDVAEGDTLDFVVHANGRDWADQTDIRIGIWKYD